MVRSAALISLRASFTSFQVMISLLMRAAMPSLATLTGAGRGAAGAGAGIGVGAGGLAEAPSGRAWAGASGFAVGAISLGWGAEEQPIAAAQARTRAPITRDM